MKYLLSIPVAVFLALKTVGAATCAAIWSMTQIVAIAGVAITAVQEVGGLILHFFS